jgi:hypothetical protein
MAPYGTLCQVMESDKKSPYYIQSSLDEQTPSWMAMGDFLEMVFKNEMLQEAFRMECLKKLDRGIDYESLG